MADRRIGALTSKTRSVLLDAAEELMQESGYAAVTSRRLAAKAGLKPQLVHYYFRTMDELFLALLRRMTERLTGWQDDILNSDEPLKDLWEMISDRRGVVLIYELVALGNHRKAIRAEIAECSNRLREGQIKILTRILDKKGAEAKSWSPTVLTVLMNCVARNMALEDAMGATLGHAETLVKIGRYIEQLES